MPLEEVVAPQVRGSRPMASFGSVDGLMVAQGRALAPGILALRPAPMVAREDERRELISLVDEVADSKGPMQRMVALIGEAGVGKSRLTEWLCEQVHESGRMQPLRARYGRIPTPLDGITGAVNTYFNLEGADRALVEQTLMARWEVNAQDDDALTWVAATAEWLRPTPPGTIAPLGPTGKRFVLDRPELRWIVVRRVLERIGRDRPVLLWLDDLHLSSPNTFEMLARLRSDATRLRILVVATARSETLATDLDAALRMEATRVDWNGKVMDLRPLGTDETEVLLRAMFPLAEDAGLHAGDGAESRKSALRTAAPARVGWRRVSANRRRAVPRPRRARSKGARSPPRNFGTNAFAPSRPNFVSRPTLLPPSVKTFAARC